MVNEAVIPNSEMVPSSHAKCSSILRVAHHFRRSHPRIAYLCVHGALEESKRIDPLLVLSGVRQFRFTLERWIEKNDETSGQGQFHPNIDVPYLQSFCLDYYEKAIIAMIKIIGNQAIDSSASASTSNDNQASSSVNVRDVSDQLIYACKTARVLFKVLELLSKDVPLTSEILEAHTEVKQLAKIFRPYNLIPHFDYNEYHPIRRLPKLQAAINALNNHPWSPTIHQNKQDEDIESGMFKQVNNPSPARAIERPACKESKPAVLETETTDKLFGFQLSIQVPELLIFLFSISFLIFLVLFVIFLIKLCAKSNNPNGVV